MGRIKQLDDLKWGSIKSFVKNYAAVGGKKDPDTNNFILSKNMRLRIARYKEITEFNNNVIVIGNAGAGKTRLYVKPNILQRSMSYVVTDKSGVLYNELSSLFKSSGYTVKILNSLDPERSDYYNPMAYVREPDDINDMSTAILASDNNEVYYQNVKRSLLNAIIGYVFFFADSKQKTLKMIKMLLDEMECTANDSGDNWKIKPNDDLDRRFLEVEATEPDNMALHQYETFRIMCGSDKASIVNQLKRTIEALSAGVIDRSGDMDSLELDKLGDSKHILFIVRPNTGVNAELPALLYTQVFMALFGKAQKEPLNYPVHCMMNDFPENGKIHDFPRLLLSMKKYDISCSIIVQNIDQIRAMYKDMWQTLIRNCSMQVYLGGRDQETIDYIINTLNETKGKIAGTVSKTQLDDMSDDDCIVIATGAEAYLDEKY